FLRRQNELRISHVVVISTGGVCRRGVALFRGKSRAKPIPVHLLECALTSLATILHKKHLVHLTHTPSTRTGLGDWPLSLCLSRPSFRIPCSPGVLPAYRPPSPERRLIRSVKREHPGLHRAVNMAHLYDIGTRAWQPDPTEEWVASEVAG